MNYNLEQYLIKIINYYNLKKVKLKNKKIF